jgi:hypothetical protein
VRRMTPFVRWCLVALGTTVVVLAPFAVRALPVGESDLGAARLLERVTDAEDAAYSGYVETDGALALPVADQFDSVGSLFGEQNRLRVWWGDEDSWRVDRLLLTGEQDLIHDGAFTTEYDYEDAEAVVSSDPDIRLPRTADLLPPALASRALGDSNTATARLIDGRRVAGIAAPGLRLEPDSELSSVDHVDLWADPDSGTVLRVEIWSDGAGPDLVSEFREFTAGEPPAERLRYTPAADTEASYDDVLDIADAANQYAPLRPPTTVAGLAQSTSSDGAVGVYGTGLTQLIAIPLRSREGDPLREQIAGTPGATTYDEGVTLTAGILTVLLTGEEGDGGWLVAGTVTPETARTAAVDLVEGTVFVDDDP